MKKKKDIFKINNKDVYVRSRVHTWTTKLDDERLKDWAKMFKLKLKSKKLIGKGSSYHYVNPKPRFCASATVTMPLVGMSEVIVLPKNKNNTFSKKKKRKKK